MTPNGAGLYFVLSLISIFVDERGPIPLWTFISFGVLLWTMGFKSTQKILSNSIVLVAPLAFFLYLVWVVIVGSAPTDAHSINTMTPIHYVLRIVARVFLFTILVLALVEKFSDKGAIWFLKNMSMPSSLRLLLMLTLSLKNTFIQAANRAHTALVIASVLTPRISLKNLTNGWRLIQTIWMTTLSISMEKMDSKWVIEKLPESCLARLPQQQRILTMQDKVWIMLATVSIFMPYLYRHWSGL